MFTNSLRAFTIENAASSKLKLNLRLQYFFFSNGRSHNVMSSTSGTILVCLKFLQDEISPKLGEEAINRDIIYHSMKLSQWKTIRKHVYDYLWFYFATKGEH